MRNILLLSWLEKICWQMQNEKWLCNIYIGICLHICLTLFAATKVWALIRREKLDYPPTNKKNRAAFYSHGTQGPIKHSISMYLPPIKSEWFKTVSSNPYVHILIIFYYSRCDAIEEANAGRDFGDTGRWGCTVILTILIILILAETDGDGDTAETRVIPRTRRLS